MNVSKLSDLPARLPGKLGERERGPVVSVVRLHGTITPTPSPVQRNTINMSTVESALTRAFGHERLAAVALSINSPGGAPTQSALVADRIRELATKNNVPVLAFCEDVAASGGYWLACAGDEVYAHGTSLVGSIGVISAGFGLDGLLQRLGVDRRVHTAGERKLRLDPFSPEREDDVRWLQGMQEDLHAEFVSWVRERRGQRLSESDDLFSGEVWTGGKAAQLGLVDGLGTLRRVVTQRYPNAHIVFAEPRKPLLARLGVSGGPTSGSGLGSSVLGAVEALEQRLAWARFGL